jgi:phosphoribosylglycinamide formyltransferase 1
MITQPARLALLISGNGSNLQAVLDACQSGHLPAKVVVVVSNKADAYGLERAKMAGVPSAALVKPKEQDRRVYDAKLAQFVAKYQPDWVVLAGWMRILSASFLDEFPQQVINIHPALPGCFPGTHAIQRAYEAYQRKEIKSTGVMVHQVPDEGVDNGPVLGQEVVPIMAEDTLETLESRVHQCEHRLLVKTLQLVINNPLVYLEGRNRI